MKNIKDKFNYDSIDNVKVETSSGLSFNVKVDFNRLEINFRIRKIEVFRITFTDPSKELLKVELKFGDILPEEEWKTTDQLEEILNNAFADAEARYMQSQGQEVTTSKSLKN